MTVQVDYSRDSLLDAISIARLKDSYMTKDEVSPQDRYKFVSEKFSSNPAHAQRLYDYASKHWFGYSTPILSFGRNKDGLPISCFLTAVQDTKAGLVDALSETNWLSMLGGGVGVYFNTRGADEKSVGVIPHMKVYDDSCLAFKQGSTRRGSYAMYLDISHPDILEFLEMRKETGDPRRKCLNLHHGVNIPDSFMKIIEKCMLDPEADDAWELKDPASGKVHETVSAKDLWVRLLELRAGQGRGEPYLHFIDNVNNALSPELKKVGYKVTQSNLCVAPETLILTDEGYQVISDLENESVNVWNGKEFTKTVVKKTGENQKLLRVVTNSGFELECTPYHKFYVAIRSEVSGNTKIVEKRAIELKAGDKLIKSNFPIIDGTNVLSHPYENGLFSADGCVVPNGQRIYLYHEKRKLKEHLDNSIFRNWYVQENQNREYGDTRSLEDKFFVPFDNYTVESKIKWLEGFVDGDGTVCLNGNTQSIQCGSINKNFLLEIQMMLQTLGVSSKVMKATEEGMRLLPANDGSGNNKEFLCKESWRIMFGQTGIVTLRSLGFNPKRLHLTDHQPNRECSQFVKVVEVLDEGRIDDTFCFTETNRGMGIFNGILTGQCNEVELMTDENNTAVCCLSSINLEYWDEYKDNYQFFLDLLEMLDNTIQYFIDHAPEQIGKAKYSAIRERSVGLGVMGYHSYLQKKMIPFESVLAKSLNISIFSQFAAMRMKANLELGALRGEPELLKDSGMRFAHTCALAPTASNALICGNVSPSIEPWHANAFRQDTLSGTFIQKNKHLDTIIKEITKSDAAAYDSLWHSVVQNDGSIQEIDEFDEDTKEVFKTAAEIDQMWMVEQLCDRQHFVDQGQSFNIFIRPDISIKRLHAIHFTTWKRGGKGMYYVRSEKLKNTEKVGTKIKRVRIEDDIDMKSIANGEVCAACEG